VNGAAARKIAVGDRLVICAFAGLTAQQIHLFQPSMVYCDDQNYVLGAKNIVPVQLAS
jgi:aspartate 1-decarboxylase